MRQRHSGPAIPRPDAEAWWRQSLYRGAAGIGLLHMEQARMGIGDWHTAHLWATAMTRAPLIADPKACGLYQGAPAVAFALQAAGPPLYAKALATLDAHITTMTLRLLEEAHERIDRGQRPALREFDLISGLTGLGAYLLRRHAGSEPLLGVLRYLVRLTEPLKTDGVELPGWWSDNGPGDQPSTDWPGGHANLGMAHGIAGPLALLGAAMRHDNAVPGQADAIGRILGWLDLWRSGAGARAWWPETISRQEHHERATRRPGPGRPSWCYGTPGLARSQQIAALALGDPQRKQLAEEALLGCLDDERQLAQLTDASLCHGWAGVLHTTWRTTTEAGGDSPLVEHLPRLHARTEEHLRRHGPPPHDGLMDGTAGVFLAHHTSRGDTSPGSGWDACLLLAG
ncbi:lanthionine synthetase C family protein [Streptomyces sp. PT12]|uniref:lanthionine synthetase C family protein n=1 Tax=Streptomyces sp. PT12 TaxID=1510197 RepID=UPI000DE29163|nr:lanthionine synthetase C family protein [Streptomyces sp. PT12]RBM14153.1 lanthionine synthetase [Streptomyces sp. PT12]